MKICFFGTGHGVPEAHKKCTATLLQVGENSYLFDAGCDVAYEMAEKRVKFDSLKALFITHSHSDHTNGIVPLLAIASWYYTSCDPKVYFPNEGMRNSYLEHVLPYAQAGVRDKDNLRWYSAGEVYDDGVIKVTAYKTEHCQDSHCFLVEAEGKRVLFGGDMKNPKIDFPPVDDLDAAIVEGAHFYITDYEEPFKERKIKAAYINHYGNYIGLMNAPHLRPLQKAVPEMKITLATDGMDIEV